MASFSPSTGGRIEADPSQPPNGRQAAEDGSGHAAGCVGGASTLAARTVNAAASARFGRSISLSARLRARQLPALSVEVSGVCRRGTSPAPSATGAADAADANAASFRARCLARLPRDISVGVMALGPMGGRPGREKLRWSVAAGDLLRCRSVAMRQHNAAWTASGFHVLRHPDALEHFVVASGAAAIPPFR